MRGLSAVVVVTQDASLPVQLTSLIGRERELEVVEGLLGKSRLVTLTGAGGSGKTRLAMEAAVRVAGRYEHGVVWVELAALKDGSLVPQAVEDALGVHRQSGGSPEEAALAALATRTSLLVLDNAEHVIDGCARMAEAVVRSCAGVHVLVTSREALGITGEVAWLVPPLPVPAPTEAHSIELAGRSPAVQLFLERARAVVPDFALTTANVAAVVQVCRRLDGIPLALEFAAARLRSLTAQQIAERLDDRFRLLTSGARTALPRQRTLRGTIDWSYDLLSEAERVLLARLSVFAGSFSLESVEEVCGGPPLEPIEVMERLADLVEKSMIEIVDRETEARYRLLETVRQYAAERLADRGEVEEMRRRCAAHYAEFVARAEPHLTTPAYPAWVARLTTELDNVRQSLTWARDRDPSTFLDLAGRLCWFWFSSAHLAEGRRWLEDALAHPVAAEPTRARAQALLATGVAMSLQGEPRRARPVLEECISLARALGEPSIEGHGLNYLALTHVQEGTGEGREIIDAAIARFQQLGDLYGLRPAYLLLGNLLLSQGKVTEAVAACEEALRIARKWGRERELGVALQSLGTAVLQAGDLDRAARLFRDSLEALSRQPLHVFIARSLELLGLTLLQRGAPEDAVRLIGAAAAFRQVIGAAPFKIDRDRVAPAVARARELLGPERFDAVEAQGRSLALEDAIALALSGGEERPEPAAPGPPAASRGPLAVNALGPLEILLGGVPLHDEAWRYAKPRELLLFLLCHPEGRVRDQIGAALWPESSPARVKNSFHVTLHHLRKALGATHWVRLERGRYSVDPADGVEFDVERFEQEVTGALKEVRRGRAPIARLEAVLPLYRGDFLDGEPVSDWHLELRDRLRALYLDAVLALGDALLGAQRPVEALERYEQAIRRDAVREEAYRGLMTARARLGDPDGAAREYARLETAFRRELDMPPSHQATTLLERIRRGERV